MAAGRQTPQAVKLSAEEIASAIVELVEADLDTTLRMFAAVMAAIREGHEDDKAEFLALHRPASDPARLEMNHWRLAPKDNGSGKDETKSMVAKLLAAK